LANTAQRNTDFQSQFYQRTQIPVYQHSMLLESRPCGPSQQLSELPQAQHGGDQPTRPSRLGLPSPQPRCRGASPALGRRLLKSGSSRQTKASIKSLL